MLYQFLSSVLGAGSCGKFAGPTAARVHPSPAKSSEFDQRKIKIYTMTIVGLMRLHSQRLALMTAA